MTLPLKPEMFPAAYELIRAIVPAFRVIPHADEIEFRVVNMRDYADCDGEVIRISSAKNGHLNTLLGTLAHEMIHVWQVKRGIPIGHGPEFKKLAAAICKRCGWDPKAF